MLLEHFEIGGIFWKTNPGHKINRTVIFQLIDLFIFGIVKQCFWF